MAHQRGEGRVFQRGSRWWIAFFAKGRERRESAGTTPEQACERLKTRLAQVRLGQYVLPAPATLTIAELLDAYLTHRQVVGRKETAWHRTTIGRIRTLLGDWRVGEITPARLEQWAAGQLAAGYAPGTVRIWLAYLAAALKVGRRLGLTTATPEFPTLRVDNVRHGFFEPAQFEAVCRALPAPIADVARCGYLTGWRRNEILGLTWAEVDRGARLITLPGHRSKNGRGRVLPLVGELWTLIEQRWKARTIGLRLVPWVFHREGEPIRDFYGAWAAACAEAGVPGRLFHDLRRTAIRDLVRAGVSTQAAKKVSGHRSDAVFNRYAIMGVQDQAHALEAVQRYRAGLLSDRTRTAEQS